MAAAGVGSRVVRGPSWDYGDDDGGEGVVGTVVEIGKGCYEGWAVVQWDYGSRAYHRIGRDDNEHDLLLLDSACSGVYHRGIGCNGKCTPSQVGYLAGIRWKCAQCRDFNLCTECYMNDEHVADGHTFVRINTEGSPPVQIPSRRNATKIPMRGLFQGATVKRSRFWQREKEDGYGDIVCVTGFGDDRVAEVRWRQNKGTFKCRIGGKHIPELTCTANVLNRHYYKDHLPVFGEDGVTQEDNKRSTQTKFNSGDRVAMTASHNTLFNMGLSTEIFEHIKEITGKIGFLQKTTESDAHVVYQNGQVKILPAAILEKVPDIKQGDNVRLKTDKAQLKRLLPGHGGWNVDMEKDLGKSAKVMKVDTDGNVIVRTKQRRWNFHPCCLDVIQKSTYTKGDSDNDDDASTLKDFEGVHHVEPGEIRLEEILGEGAFGKVHRAVWRETPVAVKVLSTEKNEIHHIEREISVHIRAQHPNIVRMMALSYKDKETLLVMQLVEGSNLKDLLFSDNHRHKMSLSKAEKVQISLGILQAIRYLHESKILHLDIKPSNIIVEKLGKKAYLCDLGFAHMESLNSPKASSLSVRGTRYYMPPECLKASRRGRDPGESVMTSASDIWSLGCTLLELLTEKPLWGIAPHSYLLTDHLNGFYNQPPVLRRADSDIKRIMRPCLREEPNERPSAAELMNRFQELPMRICLSGNE